MSSRSADEWRRYLSEYSADVLRVGSEQDLEDVSEAQRAGGWLGFDGADDGQLAALEQRLGSALPPDYRSFLSVSDGWLNLGPFMWTMRDTSDVGWLRDANPQLSQILRDHGTPEEIALVDRALLVSGEGDAQYWLLDPGDVSPDGDWAAYVWANWYPGFGERHRSFTALVDHERASFERLRGRDGRPIHPDGADALVAKGRDHALRGDVDGAMDALDEAVVKGSGAGAYLAVMLKAFLEPDFVHHAIRNDILGKPHVIEAVGLEQVRAEAVPLFLHRSPIKLYRRLFAGILTDDEIDRVDTFTPPLLPEPPVFDTALKRARQLASDGSAGEAWTVLEAALPHWHPGSAHRIAPVVLLTDPTIRRLITPERARTIATPPRGIS